MSSPQPKPDDFISTSINPAIPAIPGQIPAFTTSSTNDNIPSFLRDYKRSILKSSSRAAYEAEPVKLTPGLDPSHLSTSPIAEPVIDQSRVRFSSSDQIFYVRNFDFDN